MLSLVLLHCPWSRPEQLQKNHDCPKTKSEPESQVAYFFDRRDKRRCLSTKQEEPEVTGCNSSVSSRVKPESPELPESRCTSYQVWEMLEGFPMTANCLFQWRGTSRRGDMKLHTETWGKAEWVPILPLAQHSCVHNPDSTKKAGVGFMFKTMLSNGDRTLLILT